MPRRDPPEASITDAAVELLHDSGFGGTFRVRGDSMRPTLLDGQAVAVEPVPAAPAFGDLVLFRQHDYLAVHRLLGRARTRDGRPCLRTRGDGKLRLDPPLLAEDLRGRVTAVSDGRVWRDLRARRSRAYGRAMALHDLAWAGLAAVSGRLLGSAAERAVGGIDRILAHAVHVVLFRAFHPRLPEPPGPRDAGSTGPSSGPS